jgi:hypothetical protein
MHRVPTRIRPVVYNLKPTTAGPYWQSMGWEVMQEEAYCPAHLEVGLAAHAGNLKLLAYKQAKQVHE